MTENQPEQQTVDTPEVEMVVVLKDYNEPLIHPDAHLATTPEGALFLMDRAVGADESFDQRHAIAIFAPGSWDYARRRPVTKP